MKTSILFFIVLSLVISSNGSQGAQAAQINPPWVASPEGGVHFTIPQVDSVPDLYGDINDPDLVIFFGGNEFMVMPELMKAFQKEYPQHKKIFYETLPPGIITKQLKTGSLVVGNLKVTLKPDVFTSGAGRIKELEGEGLFEKTAPYASNRLAIMVYKGNPKGVQSLRDLGKDEVLVSMPSPEIEDIAKKIQESYKKAGGDTLVQRIMKEKAEKGTTFITQIHHRQTPLRIMQLKSDVGPVWYTEVQFQKMIGNPIDLVEIPEHENASSTSVAGVLNNAPHKQAARDFLSFLQTDTAQSIFRKHGFLPVKEK